MYLNEVFQKTERMAPARLLRPRRERARAAFNLTSNFGVAAWQASRPGAFLAIRPGIGFSGMLNPILALPETHFHCLNVQCSVRSALCCLMLSFSECSYCLSERSLELCVLSLAGIAVPYAVHTWLNSMLKLWRAGRGSRLCSSCWLTCWQSLRPTFTSGCVPHSAAASYVLRTRSASCASRAARRTSWARAGGCTPSPQAGSTRITSGCIIFWVEPRRSCSRRRPPARQGGSLRSRFAATRSRPRKNSKQRRRGCRCGFAPPSGRVRAGLSRQQSCGACATRPSIRVCCCRAQLPRAAGSVSLAPLRRRRRHPPSARALRRSRPVAHADGGLRLALCAQLARCTRWKACILCCGLFARG